MTTYICGYWRIEQNVKHNLDHYLKFLPKTFEILKNKKIIFFYDNDTVLNYVKSIVKTENIIYYSVALFKYFIRNYTKITKIDSIAHY